MNRRNCRRGLLATAMVFAAANARSDLRMTLALDAGRASQKILHLREEIPAKPGALTLLYPKWKPGEHGPTGPILNFSGLEIRALGNVLAWQRDPVEMYAIHLVVPAGCDRIEVEGDFLDPSDGSSLSAGPNSSSALAMVVWSTAVVYPQGLPAEKIVVDASLRLPAGWTISTPLERAGTDAEWIRFAPVTLTTLVDSPVLAGAHLVDVDVGRHDGVEHHLVVAADRAADLDGAAAFAPGMSRLADEAQALFGARHYGSYRWLVAMSEEIQHYGLEHHESSEDRVREETLVDEAMLRHLPELLAHEYVHSWNGKYRRPAGLLSPDYLQPMRGELLWVYEGLTEYLGYVLPVRSGQWTPEYYRDAIAGIGATLDRETGRRWRPVADTAVAAQLLYAASEEWKDRRRSTDFYEESIFLWLEVDTILRQRSGGKVSLDDFCRRFHGGTSGGPVVIPYGEDDVVRTLTEIQPYDWKGFFADRVRAIQPRLPVAGLEASGWRLAYSSTPNGVVADDDVRHRTHDWTYSLGIAVDKDDRIVDVVADSPAGRAGIAPHEKLIAIGGHIYSTRAVDAALLEARAVKDPIEVVTGAGDAVRTYRLDYHSGPRYPHLERIADRPDLLAAILAPRAAPPAAKP